MYASYGIPVINKIKVATNQAIIAFIPPEGLINLDYIYYYLLSLKPFLKSKIRGTTQENLNANIVTNIEVPLPPLPEQQRIVEEIETYFSILDNMENTISQSLHQTSSIRQSILKKAFEGKLVPQDPNDEPASILLQRIKAEKNSNIKKENYQQLRID